MWVIDIGNTHIKWAEVSSEGALGKSRSAPTPTAAAHLAEELDTIWGNTKAPDRLFVGSVAGHELDTALAHWARQKWDREACFLDTVAAGWGVRNAYTEARTLGVDRWAALVATRQHFQHPVLIADIGTAVTVDALNADGEHIGGWIMPGLRLMKRSLQDHTREISNFDGDDLNTLARNTGEGVHAGVLQAVAGLIERAASSLGEQRPMLVLTGGDARAAQKVLDSNAVVVEDLVLEGLALMASSQP